jgi:peptidyl-prolyl cis-trans isomerase C
MRPQVRLGLAAAMAAAMATTAVAQAPPAGKTAPRSTAPAPAPAPVAGPAQPNMVVATVNGEPITKGEVVTMLNTMLNPGTVPAGSQQGAYETAVDLLVNAKLLSQFLKSQRISVDPKDVEAMVTQEANRAKQEGSDLNTRLAGSGMTLDDLRGRISRVLQWKKYILGRASESELRRYVDKNEEAFNGTLVRASHILLKVDPDASDGEKAKVRQRLEGIKKEIQSGQISFADAANKYSEDDGNKATPSGGDLGYFPRRGQFIEPFAAAAFALKKGEISQPIETEYGWHLIQVTDRKPGQKIDFAQNRDKILNVYAEDTQAEIVAQARKTAKIDVKPMPPDLFPKEPVAAPATAAPADSAAPKAAPR